MTTTKPSKIKWERYKEAPIPDYHSTDGRWRIYKGHLGWCLQDRRSPDHPEPIYYLTTMADAKHAASFIIQGELGQ